MLPTLRRELSRRRELSTNIDRSHRHFPSLDLARSPVTFASFLQLGPRISSEVSGSLQMVTYQGVSYEEPCLQDVLHALSRSDFVRNGCLRAGNCKIEGVCLSRRSLHIRGRKGDRPGKSHDQTHSWLAQRHRSQLRLQVFPEGRHRRLRQAHHFEGDA